MPNDDELELNSLDRYSKSSPNYVLETYSSCEIPAGCGGVVLRWVNPKRGVPISIHVHTHAKKRDVYLDGTPFYLGRPVLTFGDHVFAFEVQGYDHQYAVLWFAALFSDMKYFAKRYTTVDIDVSYLSQPDGTWRYTIDNPGEGWNTLDYDDSDWHPMVTKEPRPLTEKESYMSYTRKQMAERGAEPLGVRHSAKTVWIRKRITLERKAVE